MQTVAEFQDWNPDHFLDTAEMTAGMALGYDWLYDRLSPETREKIRGAILDKGLQALLSPAKPGQIRWEMNTNNWNAVCYGGLTLGALAIGDEVPAPAEQVLERVRAGNPRGLSLYAPEGVGVEGPGYWSYGTGYEILLISALESALGTDWGLAGRPGFLASAGAVVQTTAPSGRVFNYSDGSDNAGFRPALFWFAQRLHDPGLIALEAPAFRAWLDNLKAVSAPGEADRFLPLVALWWQKPSEIPPPHLPTRWLGRGDQPLVVFRSSWKDPGAMWLAAKGGKATLSHAHMDAGSFVFEADGERWASDLGAQSYLTLESKGVDLWNFKQDSGRWRVFRLNNRNHNTLTINDQLHRVEGAARIMRFSGEEECSSAVWDLSPVFAGQASRVTRGFAFRPGKQVLVSDLVEGLKPGDMVRWTMVTGADIALEAGRAVLKHHGKQCAVELLAPANAHWVSTPADPPPDGFNAPNKGFSLLTAEVVAPASGQVEIKVVLSPGQQIPSLEPLASVPLDQWPDIGVPSEKKD
jgi:hypothetical protein